MSIWLIRVSLWLNFYVKTTIPSRKRIWIDCWWSFYTARNLVALQGKVCLSRGRRFASGNLARCVRFACSASSCLSKPCVDEVGRRYVVCFDACNFSFCFLRSIDANRIDKESDGLGSFESPSCTREFLLAPILKTSVRSATLRKDVLRRYV